ncbi:MAG: hypothetical protein QOI28_3159, partial [Mycobacterium sp.]|nr:hypothetical protein [Mycobacterium sp.]
FTASTPTRGRFKTEGMKRDSPEFLAVNAFGTVFETVRMFEESGALGRRVSWAFEGEQLLVVPRAGEWANAFYDRSTRSLQFFWFESGEGRVYTALSRDIVAHECGHALLDAVIPSLHDASGAESLAIHEGVADLVAVLMALRSGGLRQKVLEQNDNSISNATAFSSIAEQFGIARPRPDDPHPHALRDLLNDNTMTSVSRTNPHQLSTVLSAIFYETLVDIFERGKSLWSTPAPGEKPMNADHAANRSLGIAADIFRRLLLRGIDYMPPGELTFGDVGRATLAADNATDPDGTSEGKTEVRQRLAQRFVERGVVSAVTDLALLAPQELNIAPADLADIRDSDWAAYAYVEKHRAAFGIAEGVSFKVLPRVDATKKIGSGDSTQRELILKVSWDSVEANGSPAIPAAKRRVRTGATLAVRWDDGRVLALVGSDVMRAEQREGRDRFLTSLLSGSRVAVVEDGDAAPQPPPASRVEVRIMGDVARVTGTERLLHIEEMD